MHRLFAAVVAPLIEAARPGVIAEVGAGSGRLTRRVLEAAGAEEALVHAIDPAPRIDPDLREAEAGRLLVHAKRATSVLGSIGPVDLALLDGDPNWHSVRSEMRLLTRTARRAERAAPLIVVHNIHWPFGRRDGYYDPEAIPPSLRREHTDLGLVPGRREPAEEGLRLVPASAIREFEPRSGVLTAVEDFVADSDLDWTLVEAPGFHGAAVLAEARLLEQHPTVAAALEALRSSRFLGRQARRAESARLEAELELAAARRQSPEEAAAETPVKAEEPEPAPEPRPEIVELTKKRDALLVEVAQERARREAVEWRLERLEGDLAERDRRFEAQAAERDSERRGASELRERLERELAERDQELQETEERARLARGRLAHNEDLAGVLREERDRLRAEAERLRTESSGAHDSLAEVVVHLDRAEQVARGGWFARLAAPFRRKRPPGPLEEARAAAQRALPPAVSDSIAEGEAGQVEAGRR
ncbi:MAG TPA: hypothetical protein VJU14_02945 [Solirubrobacterales bacterium]|nr:hypothetical protein [Solirubrobacterales bacterium]